MIKYFLLLLPLYSTAQQQAENYVRMSGVAKFPADGGTVIGNIETGDWMEYTINPPLAGEYIVSFRVATPNTGSKLTFGSTIINLPTTGGNAIYTTYSTSVVLNQGPQTIRITSNSYRWNINWFEIGPPPVPKPMAFARADTTIQFPQDWFLLQGVATNGTGVWSGPNLHEAMATKLYKDTYQFVYTVTGPGGIAKDTINVTAEWNPDKVFTVIEGGAFGRYAVTNAGVVYLIMK